VVEGVFGGSMDGWWWCYGDESMGCWMFVVADLTMFLFSRQEWSLKQRSHTLLVIRSCIPYLPTYLSMSMTGIKNV